MSGKGAKGLLTGKTNVLSNKDKDKKKPTTRSSRAGLQVSSPFLNLRFTGERKRRIGEKTVLTLSRSDK